MPGLGTILSTAEKTVLGAGAKSAGKVAVGSVAKSTATNAAAKAAEVAVSAPKTIMPAASRGGLFSKITSGLGKATRFGGSLAGSGISKIGRMAGNPLLAGAGGLLSKMSDGTDVDEPKSRIISSQGSGSGQSSVRGYGSNSSDDSVSFLRIISGDIAEIKDTTNQIHQDTDKDDKKSSGGLGILAGLSTLLGGLFSKFLGPIGANILKMVPLVGRMAMSAASGLVKGGAAVGSLVAKGFGKLFGKSDPESFAGESPAKTRQTYRDPKTGRFITKEAYESLSKNGSTLTKLKSFGGKALSGVKTLAKDSGVMAAILGSYEGAANTFRDHSTGYAEAYKDNLIGKNRGVVGDLLGNTALTFENVGNAMTLGAAGKLGNQMSGGGWKDQTEEDRQKFLKDKEKKDDIKTLSPETKPSSSSDLVKENKQDEKDKKNAQLTGTVAAAGPTSELKTVNETLKKILDKYDKGGYGEENQTNAAANQLPDSIDPGDAAAKESALTPIRTGNFEKDLLNSIGTAESGKAGYNAVFNGSRAKPKKNLEDMTIDEVRAFQKEMLNEQKARGKDQKHRSSAVGRYQFISSTLESMIGKTGLKGSDKFSKENQDKLALALLNQNGMLDKFSSGKISSQKFQNYIASQQASVKNTSGSGTYDGLGSNRAYHDVSGVLAGRGSSNAGNLNDSTKKNMAGPIIIQQPVPQPVQSVPKSSPVAGVQSANESPYIVRNPDSPIRINANILMSTT